MLEVFDRGRKKTAILENAYTRQETKELNAVGSFSFTLPDEDPKTEYCRPYHYVRNDGGQLYRIITPGGMQDATGAITYRCEHVIATLIDDVLFGAHVAGNIGTFTAGSIQYVLDRQTVKNWVLGECDFSRQFEYGWENENLLAALYSIPNRMIDPYIWTFDTSVYPWVINLKRIDTQMPPQFYARKGRNLLKRQYTQATQDICTRLYCLGYGEGVNQLTISEVNGGIPYLQSPPEIVEKYGLITRIWVDRRFEDAQSLMERGQALLEGYQEPQYSVDVTAADLYPATGIGYDQAEIGRIAALPDDGIKTYITAITRNLDVPGDMKLTLATKAADIASSIADLADRQRIEQVYSQGATQLYGQSVQANATPGIGAVLNFWIPEEMRIINKVLAKITLASFRSYSRATAGGGAATTTSGGGRSSTTNSGNEQFHVIPYTIQGYQTGSASGSGSHRHSMPSITIEPTIFTEGHSHWFYVPDHDHQTPDHTHGIEQGIFEFGSPSAATIKVNGVDKGTMGEDHEIDLTAMLLDDTGKIPRGCWHQVEIIPNDLAYVTIDMYVQGFVQSRGGATY